MGGWPHQASKHNCDRGAWACPTQLRRWLTTSATRCAGALGARASNAVLRLPLLPGMPAQWRCGASGGGDSAGAAAAAGAEPHATVDLRAILGRRGGGMAACTRLQPSRRHVREAWPASSRTAQCCSSRKARRHERGSGALLTGLLHIIGITWCVKQIPYM
jgi:hypothetical protein